MAECKICSDYTKLKSGLCFICFQKNHETMNIMPNPGDSTLKSYNRTYFSSILTECVAKTPVKELFISLKYNVFNYNAGNNTFVPGRIKSGSEHAPDFVLQDPLSDAGFFAKIKFCPDGKLKYADIPAKYLYPRNMYIIVVSKKQVKCLTVQELRSGKEISPECDHYLSTRKEFTKHKSTIENYCEFSSKFFKAV